MRYIADGGISRFIYGGNAFLYHLTLGEYEQLLEWQASIQRDGLWLIPSAGPSYGRLMDQAKLLRRFAVPCVMTLPCGDPRDAAGLERGLREFAEAANVSLMIYLKEETNMGTDLMAGLDVVARLVDEHICTAIKYAVVRKHPEKDRLPGRIGQTGRSAQGDQRHRRTTGGDPSSAVGLAGIHYGLGLSCSFAERGDFLRLPDG